MIPLYFNSSINSELKQKGIVILNHNFYRLLMSYLKTTLPLVPTVVTFS